MSADGALAQAYSHCREVAKREARNFYFAFLTLPRAKRQAIYAVYAFARICDDIADGEASTEAKLTGLADVRRSLERAYDSAPEGPVFTALADVAATYRIEQSSFQALVGGVEMDTAQNRYATFEDLRRYCYGVASTVGLICVEVFGYARPEARCYAVDLGLAMQLTNILRDIQEDAERDRIYIPQDELARFGYSEENLSSGVVNRSFTDLMRFQAERARSYYSSSARLLPLVPVRSRACISVLHGLYSRLLDRIEARHFDVFHGRVRLGTAEKVLLTAKLWAASLLPARRGK